MKTSETIGKIGEALALSQGEMANVSKDRANPFFNSTYATLGAVLDACRPVLASHGIAIVQGPANTDGGKVEVETRLVHSSGEWLSCAVAVQPGKADAQGLGSVVTYLRRYSLAAMVGLAQDDDDGNSATHGKDTAVGKPAPKASKPAAPVAPQTAPAAPTPGSPAPNPARWSDAVGKRFCTTMTEWGLKYADVAAWCESLGRPRPSGMTEAQRKTVLDFLGTKAGADMFDAWLAKATGGLAGRPEPHLADPKAPQPTGAHASENASQTGSAEKCPKCNADVPDDIAVEVAAKGSCPNCPQE